MKTSNKLLLTVTIIIFVCVVVFAVFVRMNLMPGTAIKIFYHPFSTHQIVGDGNVIIQQHVLPKFNAITIGGNNDVIVRPGKKSKVAVTADKNVLQYLKIYVVNNSLQIHNLRSVILKPTKPIKITITAPDLQNMIVGGVNEVHVFAVNKDSFSLSVAGMGRCYLLGKTKNFHLNVGGVGHVYAKELKAENTTVHIGGAGTIFVYASNNLHLNVAGMGRVTYYGHPKHITQKIAGRGKIDDIAAGKKGA